ncbi:DsbA family protein [Fulvivirga sp. M361]|uniref:DsbA family protein n=1 Tax=Fulvivirga sp. M361 TaxID=2594266 RepID=UPI001179CA46|nr:DsbA family protein [Fulvivirga sp. M361]TRX58201.1 DsbA family protein [Fulvivirga sp. M361]
MNTYCDPETGICTPSTLQELSSIGSNPQSDKTEIIYVGDPMCSWCWGISPALVQLRDHFRKSKVAFRVIVGGLRPGGGQSWNDQMKAFLKHHWEQVTERSGQPFGYELLDQEAFNYDTEPSCRAVVAARPLVKEREMEFFEAIQHKFYVESQDPGKASFYAGICDQFDINYGVFLDRFENAEIKQETMDEFNINRSWGIQGYPSVLLLHNDQLHKIAYGYSTFDQMKEQVEYWLISGTK